jgi:hypothetical protein
MKFRFWKNSNKGKEKECGANAPRSFGEAQDDKVGKSSTSSVNAERCQLPQSGKPSDKVGNA